MSTTTTISDYYSVFKARMTADGSDYKDQIEKLAQRNFDTYIAESPTTETITCNGTEYTVTIVENKQDEYRLSKQMLTKYSDSLEIGNLIMWEEFDPASDCRNYWIIWKKQQNSIKDHNVYYISRCNHLLKWIDSSGVRHEQYVYEFSSKETMIRATFKSRVQEIIASEPNKYMEIIMPYTENIKKQQRFIINSEAWYVIEYDSSSASGITYVTLGEDKKDAYDDLIILNGSAEDLADYNKEHKNYIDIAVTTPIVERDTSYTIKPLYYKEGIYSASTSFDFYSGTTLLGSGTFYEDTYDEDTTIDVKLSSNNDITNKVTITVSEEEQTTITYTIVGNDSIKWNRTGQYFVNKEENGIVTQAEDVTYSIDDTDLAEIEVEDNDCYIKANNKRQIGNITLTATIDETSITKQIKITSIW